METFQDFGSSNAKDPNIGTSPTPPKAESRSKIAAALAMAQAVMKPPHKNKTVDVKGQNGQKLYSFDYADYGAIVEAVKGPLSGNDIAWTHLIETFGTGFHLVTKLIHSSGQELICRYPLPSTLDAKAFGGAMTYGKRYSLSALTGCVAEEDLDADRDNVIDHKSIPPAEERRPPVAPKTSAAPPVNPKTGPVTEAQIKRLFTIASVNKWETPNVKEYMESRWGLSSTKELSRDQYDQLVEVIESSTFPKAMFTLSRDKISAGPKDMN
jgi:hypothetical protein